MNGASGSGGPGRGRARDRSPRLSRSLKESSEALSDDDSSEVSKRCRSASPDEDRPSSRSRSRSRERDERGYDTDEAIEFYEKTKPKPSASTPEGEKYRWGRYAKRAGKNRQSFAEWHKKSFEPAKKGGRPGRGGGPPQKARRMKLERDEGFKNVENVELGGRFPDMLKEEDGAKEYVEVGRMNLDGSPCAREADKLKEEIPALDEGDKLTFVASDGRRVTYESGESPSVVDSRKADKMDSSAKRSKAEQAVAKEMGLL